MDLFALDRAVHAAWSAHRKLGSAMPWEAHRAVAGQRTLRELAKFEPSILDRPLRDALVAHVQRFTVLRVTQEVEERLGAAQSEARTPVRLEEEVLFDWHEAWRGFLAARSAGEARAYFSALPELAPSFEEPQRTLREMRHEAWLRLGVVDETSTLTGVPRKAAVETARHFLSATHDLSRYATAREEPWPLDMDLRLARGAASSWPARLVWRTASDLMPGLPTTQLDLGAPPALVGAASFARALALVGAAFRRAQIPAGTPFALREPPVFLDATRTGLVFGAITAMPSFHTRILGLAPGAARDQARIVARAFFLDARLAAARVVVDKGNYDETTAEVFGAPVPRALAGVWPTQSATPWLAMVSMLARHRALIELEGDDWFRNPRAFTRFRESPTEREPTTDDAALLAREFESVIA